MKNCNIKLFFCLIITFCACFLTCQNPIIEKWWTDGGKTVVSECPCTGAGECACNCSSGCNCTGGEIGGSGETFGVVVFNADGGTPQPKALKIAWNSAVGRLRPISKAANGFLGWYDENNTLWDVETRLVKKEDDKDNDGFITLTAKWSQTIFTVTFITNNPNANIDPQLIGSGGKIVQPVNPQAQDDGKGFFGWYSNPALTSPWDFANGIVTADVTLYARWEANVRTVIFIANGGTRPDGSIMTRVHFTVPVGGLVQDPGPVVKEGFSFGGWCPNPACLTDSACTDACKWKFQTDTVSSNSEPLYLYAKWVQSIYYVNFNIAPSSAAAPAQQTVVHGGKVTQPPTPAPLSNGSVFDGWYTLADWDSQHLWSFLYSSVTETMTLYAKWLPKTSEPTTKPEDNEGSGENFGFVIFDTDGGTPQPKALKVAWDSVVGRLRPITRGGDGFIGWVDENGAPWDVETRKVLKPEDDPNSDKDGDGFITLTVQWEPYTPAAPICIISFVTYPPASVPNPPPPDAAVIIPDQYVAQGSKVVQPAQPPVLPAPDNRGFAGWFTDESYDFRFDFDLTVPSDTTSLTLYAKWVDTYRTVIFDANGGRRPDSYTELNHQFTVTLGSGQKDGLVQDPGPIVKDGYSFAGWYYDSAFNALSAWNFATKKVTDSDVPTNEPLTLYAKWERNKYFVNFVIKPSASTDPAFNQQIVLHGDHAQKPSVNPIPGDGRVFVNWYTEEAFTNEWNFNNLVTSSMTLYAKYVAQTRTVHFQVNGGTTPGGMDFLPNRTIFVPDGKIINPGSLNREGFTFGGWFTDPECTVSWNFDTPVTQPDNVAGEDPMYLYAKWTMNPHTVRFYIGGSEVASQPVIHGEKAQAPGIDVPAGQALDGWYRNSNFTGSWNFDIDTVTSGIMLYGQWKKREFVVRYHLGTGSGNSTGKIPQSYKPADQYYAADGRVVEPSMPVNLNSDEWSFLRWDCAFPAQSNDLSNINSTSWRNNLHSYGRFGQTIDDMYTITEGGVEVLNLYARWVPPVPDMVWVPKGSFEMGDSSVSGSPASYHAYPTRRVKVDGFYISKYEVSEVDSPSGTIRGYRNVMGVNPSQFSKSTNRPVERVSWYDAVEYCIELTKGTGLLQALSMTIIDRAPTSLSGTGTPGVRPITNASVTPTWINPGYRLPTEAEWEYAARGGNGSPENYTYSGSNNPDSVAWYNLTVQAEMTGSQATQPVGSKQPNALGIYDMSGNASEWVWDWFASYKDSYYSTAPALTNPRGPASGTERIRRGGAWSNAAGNVRSVVRTSQNPGDATWVNGFRVVRGPSTIW